LRGLIRGAARARNVLHLARRITRSHTMNNPMRATLGIALCGVVVAVAMGQGRPAPTPGTHPYRENSPEMTKKLERLRAMQSEPRSEQWTPAPPIGLAAIISAPPLSEADGCKVMLTAYNTTSAMIDTLAGRLEYVDDGSQPTLAYYRFELIEPGNHRSQLLKFDRYACFKYAKRIRIMTVDVCKIGKQYVKDCGANMQQVKVTKQPSDRIVEVVIDQNAR
jgi:hypothetical protein